MAKIADSSITGELTIEVKATLTVDDDTFNTCVNIMTIYAREHGIKGMTLEQWKIIRRNKLCYIFV